MSHVAIIPLFAALADPSFCHAQTLDELTTQGHYKRARVQAESRLKANPNDGEAWRQLARVRWAYRDYDQAVKLAEKAVALDAKNADFHCQLAESLGRQAQRAGIFKGVGIARRMRAELDAALGIQPNHFRALVAYMLFYNEAPGIVGGDKRKAEAITDRIIAFSPAQGYWARGRLYEERKQPALTEEWDRKGAEADPKDYFCQTAYALTLLRTGDVAKRTRAVEVASAAAKREPGRAAAYRVMASAYALNRDFAAMERTLLEAEKLVGDDLSPHLAAAEACVMSTEFARTEKLVQKYLTQEPEGETPTHAEAKKTLEKATRSQRAQASE